MTRRLLLGYLGVTLVVLLSLEIPLGLQKQSTEQRDLTAKVAHDATVLAADAENAVRAPTQAQLKRLAAIAYGYQRRTGGRVVVVDRSGRALLDTSDRNEGAESFASRPEIRAALGGNYPSGTRHSDTLRGDLLYVAVPVAPGGIIRGAVRITYPMSTVDARIHRYWLTLASIAAVVLLAAAIVGVRLARFVTRPLRGVENAAASVGAGDLEARAPERDGPPEVRSLAAVFNETVVKLAQLLRSQEEFVQDASHELRTPLTALRLQLENLARGLDSARLARANRALDEVDRLSHTVEALLTLARTDAAASPPERVEVATLVGERVASWQPLAHEREITLRATTLNGGAARAGRDRLIEVLDNLIANALAAAPRGSTVDLSARNTHGWLELHVRDHGPGMTDEQRARAFDRFWRATPAGEGSGLGLAIVRKLVEADEGEIELAAVPGGGLDAIVRLRPV